MNAFRKALPWLVIALTASYLLSKLITTSVPGPMDLTAFSRIAVSADGRIQPVDSMARNTLLTISKKTTFKNVWLRPQQVKDYGGLARALYEGRAGGSGQKPVASHLWALMAQEQRDTIQTAATAIELSPQMKHDLVETINQVLDSDMRWLAAMRESLRAEGDRKVNFAPFYDAKTWTGVEVSAEEQVLLKGFAAYRAAVESKAEIKPFYSRPEEVDVNRKLLSRAFSDFVSAEKGVYDPAIVWLTDVIADQGKAESHRVFRIEHDRVLELMGLPPRPGNFRYAIDEFREKMGTLDKEVEALRNVNSKEFDAFQKALADLRSDLVNYMMFSQWRKPYWVPPTKAGDEWRTFHQVAQEQQARGGTVSQEAEMLAGILQAYARGDVNSFNKGVESYHKQQETLLKGDFAR